MKISVCDICKIRKTDHRFKVKESVPERDNFNKWIWSPYRKIDICEHCYKELIAIKIGGTDESR